MFDVYAVQRLAFERDFIDLVCYIDEDRVCTIYPDGRARQNPIGEGIYISDGVFVFLFDNFSCAEYV